MKFILFFVLMLFSFNVRAEDENEWEKLYENVINSYVYDVSAEDLAIAGMKGIKELDDKLTLADDASRITLYYRGKVVKVLRKPENVNDAQRWGQITSEIIDVATTKSKKANTKDFELDDIMAKNMVKILDKDSKFYESFDDVKSYNVRNKRLFSAGLKNEILNVKIGAFNKKTSGKLKEVAENVKARALVVDLRGCPGGMTGEAISVADMFLEEGIIASLKEKNVGEETYYNAKEENVWADMPIFVLVDGETASSAEILAAALKEQSRAKVIGTTTQGKSSTQKLIGMKNGSVLAITNGFFNSPSGNDWYNVGIVPDVCTFERGENANIGDIIANKFGECGKESREDSELELKIVENLLENE